MRTMIKSSLPMWGLQGQPQICETSQEKTYEKLLVPHYLNHLLIEMSCLFVCFPLEILDGVELGEPAHKKAGTTVPESIHSFSKSTL